MSNRGYNRQIINNSLLSILQISISAIAILVIYKIVIKSVGVEQFGLWSLIISVTAFSELGNFGFSGSLTKFSAELSIKNSIKQLNALLNITVVALAGFAGILIAVIYGLGHFLLPHLIDASFMELGEKVLLHVLLGLYLNILAGLFFSVLEGLNLSYLKSIATITSSLIYVIATLYFINEFGLLGLAYAYVIQASIYFLLGIYFINRKIENYNWFYLKIYKSLFKKVTNYSVKFMLMGLSQTFYDPITKVILSKYGGLNLVGLFEIATKIIVQTRAIVLGILKNILPKIVTLKVLKGSKSLSAQYEYVFKINLVLLFITLGLILPNLKLISVLFVGEVNWNFVAIGFFLVLGWFVNSLTITSYIFNLGTSNLNWNLISHISIGVLNFILCLIAGKLFSNGNLIVLAWSLALSLGSLLLLFEYHRRTGLSFKTYLNTLSQKLLIRYTLLILSSLIVNYYVDELYQLIIIQTFLIIGYILSFFRIDFIKQTFFQFKDLMLSKG